MTIAVHALTWMALAAQRGQLVMTSDEVAASINTNAVIIRRCLGNLRNSGLVEVRHGAGPGWSLAREPAEITVLDVYQAVEPGPLFALHHSEPNLRCPVGKGIQATLTTIYGGVEDALRRGLAQTTIADVLRETVNERP